MGCAMRSFIMVLGAATLLLLTGGPSSLAEGDTWSRTGKGLNFGQSIFAPFFRQQPPPKIEPRQRRRVEPQARRVAPRARREPAAAVLDDPVIPKVDVAHHIVVLGDSLGALLADGLEDALNDRPDVAVTDRAKGDSGLVRADFYDWPKAVTELLAGTEPISLAVMLLGVNDRQSIREGETIHEPLSERWLALYRERVDVIASAFAARRVPLIWVGAPPVQNGRLSADLIAFNEVYRQRVERAGGQYVDLWGAFVDSENRYAAMGPDVSGQGMRLRTSDGVHFTGAGARKAAHFVYVLIRRQIEPRHGGPVIALPVTPGLDAPLSIELQSGGIEALIDRMVNHGAHDIALAPALQAKPVAGLILPLTGASASGERGLLASIQEARGRGDVAAQLERVFGEGVAPEPRTGRIDDHRWPRAN